MYDICVLPSERPERVSDLLKLELQVLGTAHHVCLGWIVDPLEEDQE